MERLSHYRDWCFCPLIYPEPSYRCPCWSGLLIASSLTALTPDRAPGTHLDLCRSFPLCSLPLCFQLATQAWPRPLSRPVPGL